MRQIIEILGIPFDFVDMEEAVERAKKFAVGERLRIIFTPNPEIVMTAQEDEELKRALYSADMLIPDGIGIVIASGLYGNRLPERVTGFDLMMELINYGVQRGWTFYLLGGKPGVSDRAAKRLQKVYPNIRILGTYHGYMNGEEEEEIIAHINLCNPNILFVGMGAPRQEKWIFKNRKRLKANLVMAVGGALDVLAGKTKRAPKIFIKLGLEWLYRLIKEPWRFPRMLKLPLFLFKVIMDTKLKNLNLKLPKRK